MSDGEAKTRVALHGVISGDEIPADIDTTDEDGEASIIEILYDRDERHYRVLSRHRRTLYLGHCSGAIDSFEGALEATVEISRDEEYPLLRQVYSWVPVSQADEPGADRIHVPWAEDDDD